MALIAGMTVAAPASATTIEAAESADTAAIEPQLLDELEAEDTATFWVYLEDQADLSAAATLSDRDDQGWAVYEELTATAESSQSGLLEMLEAEGAPYTSYWIANTVRVTGDADLVERIAARPEVDQVTAESVYELPQPDPEDEENQINAVEWNIDRVKAPQVWADYGVTGEGIVIGSIDSGADHDHPALIDSYRGNNGDGTFDHNYNWWDPSNICGNPSLEPCDNNDHGTHTMGTMVGDDGADNQIGVAPGATWMTAKGCEARTCSDAALLSSGQFILAPTDLQGDNANPEMRPHIVNNSWGGSASDDPWYQQTVQSWVAAGIFPQFSSGNPGSACGAAGNPGNLPEAYSAGAFDINDNLYVNSGRGPSAWGSDQIKPNISAPGVGVRSSVDGGGYAAFTGTSMASPHVAAAVALMWSASEALVRDIDATRAILDGTAEDTENLACGGTAENNNVWGQGKLDVLAAVGDSPIGPSGTLTGTVTDGAEGTPIDGATITATGGDLDRERTTSDDGGYEITLPVGEYSVAASAFGYETGSASVTITEDATTTRDFGLTATDTVTVSGTVTDGSGHGWPVYASVGAQDTPLSTFTDPLTGRYSLELPVNDTYTLEVEPQYPGYGGYTETIDVTDADVTVDPSLVVEFTQCRVAAGYELDQPRMALLSSNAGFDAYFEDRGIAVDRFTASQIDQITGYDLVLFGYNGSTVNDAAFQDFLTRTDDEGTGVIFLDHAFSTHNGIRTLSRVTGNPVETGSTSAGGTGAETYYQVTQAHPILDGFAVGDQIFVEPGQAAWIAWFEGYAGEGTQVIADVGRTNADGIMGSGIAVQERATNKHVLLSMNSQTAGRNPSVWSADSEQIFWNAIDWASPGDASFECVPVEGGLVLGNVYDQNTDEGINGAAIASDADPDITTSSFGTPEDPALDDGFFWMFSPLTGSQGFTASAGNYGTAGQTVDVAIDAATRVDFSLAAGRLTVEPTQVGADVQFGDSADRTFTISNTGTASAEVATSERRGDFEILNTDGTTSPGSSLMFSGQGAEVTRIPAEVSFTAAGGDGERPEPSAGPEQDAWESLPDMPRGIMDNNVVLYDDKLYSIGGSDGTTSVAEVYVYDTEAETWDQLDDAPAIMQQSAEGVIDGRIYLAGSFSGLTADTLIYDPEADTWTSGADMPAGRAAPGSAVVDGQLYVIGGCSTSACFPTASDVFRYDPGSDTWETMAPYPEAAAFLSCGEAEGLLVCAGGADTTGAGLTGTYVYDPGANTWTQGADLPVDLWGSASTGANGMLLVAGGAALNGAVVTNESYAYDPLADTWTALPATNNAMYRGGGACGFYKAGGSTGSFNEAPFAEVLPGFTECGAPTDVPWLTVDTPTATLEPGDTITVTVSMDSALTAEQQPGAYLSGVGIRHDTPYTVAPVGVTMNVDPPRNWGKITGDVTAAEDGSPLSSALVQVNGKSQSVTLTTDETGGYGYWLNTKNNPLELVVSAAGFIPQTRESRLKPRQEVVEDFALTSP